VRYLITGGCGFLGSNLATEVLKKGDELFILDNLSRLGAYENYIWLKSTGEFKFFHADIRNSSDVDNVIREVKPDIIFHLAGQVAMTTSISNARLDFETNALGSFNVLDAVKRFSPESIVFYSSTNKVYGDLEWTEISEEEKRFVLPKFPNGLPEDIPLDFHSPYGTSKGAADQYMLDAYRIFGTRTVVFRHSSMFGGRQFSTYDQGWIGWFCQQAVDTKSGVLKEPFTISGTGKQVRDVLYADDMIELYFKSVDNIYSIQGQAFNIGGGMDNSLSLLELFEILEQELDVKLKFDRLPERQSDQKVFVADIKKINEFTNWLPSINTKKGVQKMLKWIQQPNKL
jgi:CDP-paratose 2-epimerase